ncbi:hypothetical protein [Shinella sp.]
MAVFRLRIVLDFLAVALIIACLAYWWLDNLFHEVFGTALFALVIGHNVFNRRWYGNVPKGRRDAVRVFNIVTIICLAIAMLVMLATSLLISRDCSNSWHWMARLRSAKSTCSLDSGRCSSSRSIWGHAGPLL